MIIFANEQVHVRCLDNAGTGRHGGRSNFVAIQIQLDFALIPIEYRAYVRPFILGQLVAVR
ncbi:hypothetical protein D1872_276500 [compost metagenome]